MDPYFPIFVEYWAPKANTQKKNLGSEAFSWSSYLWIYQKKKCPRATNILIRFWLLKHKHTHKEEASNSRPLLWAPTCGHSKRRYGQEQQIYTSHFNCWSTNTHTKKRPWIRCLVLELIHMVLTKEEMAKSNNFTHHILIVEAQINTQKKGLGSEVSSSSSYQDKAMCNLC